MPDHPNERTRLTQSRDAQFEYCSHARTRNYRFPWQPEKELQNERTICDLA